MLLIAVLALATAEDCGDKPSQTAMTMCQGALAEAAGAEMSRVWKSAQAAMQQADRDQDTPPPKSEPGYAQALLASQRAWLAFRDAECRIESYEWRGGSMAPFTENQCMTELTKARTQQLRAMLNWGK